MANAEKSTCQSVHARGILVTSKLTTRGPVNGAQSKLPTVQLSSARLAHLVTSDNLLKAHVQLW